MITTTQVDIAPDSSEGSNWYALHTMSNCEAKVANYLQALNVEIFLPAFSRRKRPNRLKMIQLPLIPGYLFGRWQNKLSSEALGAPGLSHIVSFAGVPAPIPKEEIDSLRRLVDSGLNVCSCPIVKTGERVRLRGGPLKGLVGGLERANDQFRLVVSVELLCRSIVTDVDRNDIEVLSKEASLFR